FEEEYVDKYIISFVVDGVKYKLGDTIRIDDATVIYVEVGQKYKITIRYGDEEECIYITPGEQFTFPADSSFVESADIIRWEYNGRYYMIGDAIDVSGDIVISPVDKKWIETNIETKIEALKNATSLQAKFNAIKDVENILALLTEEEVGELDLSEYNALKAAFDSLAADAQKDLAVAEKIG
ncbi:MAG: hypothetical protein J1F68_06355, partial [Clostridiales bacterium]|nr:hypothetical protein [Clostridiales bacterium]